MQNSRDLSTEKVITILLGKENFVLYRDGGLAQLTVVVAQYIISVSKNEGLSIIIETNLIKQTFSMLHLVY